MRVLEIAIAACLAANPAAPGPVAAPMVQAKTCESQLTDARTRCVATIREREGISFSWTVTKPGEFQLSVLPPLEGKWTLFAGLRVKDAAGAVLVDAQGDMAPLARRLTLKAGAYQLTVFPSDGFMVARGHVFDLEVWALSDGEPPPPQLPARVKKADAKPALGCLAQECASLAEEKLANSAKSDEPEVSFAAAAVLAAEGCERNADDHTCGLAQRLTSALAEFKGNAQAADARRVLHARRCTWALGWDDMQADAATRIGDWCPQALDGCRANLMGEIAHAIPADRRAIVGNLCSERLCSTPNRPKTCTRRGGAFTSSEVLTLLKVVFERELPAPVATDLHRAFSAPRHPFFQ